MREAAVAAIGAIGDELGLPAVLEATTDNPPCDVGPARPRRLRGPRGRRGMGAGTHRPRTDKRDAVDELLPSRRRLRLTTPAAAACVVHEHRLHRFVVFDDLAGTEHHRLERRLDPTHGHVGFGGEAQIHARQHSAATDQVHALHDEILCELRRGLARRHDRVHHRRDGFLDGSPDLVGREYHRLGQAAHAHDRGPRH